MKLSGGSPTLAPQLNLDAFLAQARSYEDMSTSDLGKMLRQLQTAQLSHPVPVLRAREVDRWATTQEYQSLLERRPLRYLQSSALPSRQDEVKGGWRNW